MSTDSLRPLDLGKLDFEGNRRRRRRRWLVRILPVAGMLFLVATWLILPSIATNLAQRAVQNSDFDGASGALGVLVTNGVIEPYKQPFNQAIVSTYQKKFDDAAEYFRKAIALAPDNQKCFIRVQSVLSNELAGDEAITRKDQSKAILYYSKALSDTTTYKDCFKSYSSLSERIATKLSQLYNDIKKETYQDQTSTPDSAKTDSDNPSSQQLDELQKLQQQGQEARREDTRKYTSNPDYTGKRW